MPLFGSRGLFAALRGLPALNGLSFEPATATLWAVYDNEGCTKAAKCPVGEESKLSIPEEVPKPVPYEWSSIWCGLLHVPSCISLVWELGSLPFIEGDQVLLAVSVFALGSALQMLCCLSTESRNACRAGIASVTHLTSLSVAIPLCDKLLPSQRDGIRHAWPAAAAIADYAFSQKCLASMPGLKEVALDIQHMQSSRSPAHAEEAGNAADNNNPASQIASWSLPDGQITSFSISGVALGTEQLNYKPEIQVPALVLIDFVCSVHRHFSFHCSFHELCRKSSCREILAQAKRWLCAVELLGRVGEPAYWTHCIDRRAAAISTEAHHITC